MFPFAGFFLFERVDLIQSNLYGQLRMIVKLYV